MSSMRESIMTLNRLAVQLKLKALMSAIILPRARLIINLFSITTVSSSSRIQPDKIILQITVNLLMNLKMMIKWLEVLWILNQNISPRKNNAKQWLRIMQIPTSRKRDLPTNSRVVPIMMENGLVIYSIFWTTQIYYYMIFWMISIFLSWISDVFESAYKFLWYLQKNQKKKIKFYSVRNIE